MIKAATLSKALSCFIRQLCKQHPILRLLIGALLLGMASHAQAGLNCTNLAGVPINIWGEKGAQTVLSPFTTVCYFTPESGDVFLWPLIGGGMPANTSPLRSDANYEGNPGCPVQATIPKTGHPVVISTGTKVQKEDDFITPSEMGLSLVRNYISNIYEVGIFGQNWVSNYDYKLGIAGSTSKECLSRPGVHGCSIENKLSLYRYGPDGARYTFNSTDGINYKSVAMPNARISLTKGASTLCL